MFRNDSKEDDSAHDVAVSPRVLRTFASGQVTTPETMQTMTATAPGTTQLPQQFADFLQSLPDGRAGLS